jgi:hypothetical protein
LSLLAYGGYAKFTTQENVAKLGPLEVNKEREERAGRPIVGGIALVAVSSWC